MKTNHVSHIVSVAFVAAAVAACSSDSGGEPATEWGGRIDTLPNGATHVHSPNQGIWSDGEAWRLEEDLRIGTLEGDGPDLFGNIADVAVAPDGTILVLESQSNELRYFAPDGTHLLTTGGPGQGPGELNIEFGGEIFPTPSAIIVNNTFNRRWEFFGYDGQPLGSTPNTSGAFYLQNVLGTDGLLYQRGMIREQSSPDGTPIILRWSVAETALAVRDTVMAPVQEPAPTIEASFTNNGATMMARIPVPFVHVPRWTMDDQARVWVADADGYAIERRSLEGDTELRITRDYHPVPVTEAELAEAMERFSSGPLSEASWDRSLIPDAHPPFSTFEVDASGNIWVRRRLPDGESAIDVFDPDGRYLGEMEVPFDLSRLTLYARGDDYAYGVVRDELDVQYVVRLTIVKGASPTG